MLDHDTRTAVLKLRGKGHAKRAIAKALKISIMSVTYTGENEG